MGTSRTSHMEGSELSLRKNEGWLYICVPRAPNSSTYMSRTFVVCCDKFSNQTELCHCPLDRAIFVKAGTEFCLWMSSSDRDGFGCQRRGWGHNFKDQDDYLKITMHSEAESLHSLPWIQDGKLQWMRGPRWSGQDAFVGGLDYFVV